MIVLGGCAAVVDGFRNYTDERFGQISQRVAPEEFFLDKANLMQLFAPDWTVLTGGLRVLNANHDGSDVGVFTGKVGVLTNDFFVHLNDTDLLWEKADADGLSFVLKDRKTGEPKFRASRNDLVFGSNAQLRSISDVYAGSGLRLRGLNRALGHQPAETFTPRRRWKAVTTASTRAPATRPKRPSATVGSTACATAPC